MKNNNVSAYKEQQDYYNYQTASEYQQSRGGNAQTMEIMSNPSNQGYYVA